MALKQVFELEISGLPVSSGDIDIFIKRVQARVLKVDPDIKIEVYNFAGIRYRMHWYGKPVVLGEVDTMYRQAVRYSNKYLEKWEMKIVVGYKEEETG